MGAQRRGHRVGGADRCETEHERKELDRQDVAGEEDADHRAERSTGRYAQNVGRHERIAEQTLVGGTGAGECRADEQRREHARAADVEYDGLCSGGQSVIGAVQARQ